MLAFVTEITLQRRREEGIWWWSLHQCWCLKWMYPWIVRKSIFQQKCYSDMLCTKEYWCRDRCQFFKLTFTPVAQINHKTWSTKSLQTLADSQKKICFNVLNSAKYQYLLLILFTTTNLTICSAKVTRFYCPRFFKKWKWSHAYVLNFF